MSILNEAFDFCTSKLARQEVRFVGKERDFLCREDFFVLKKLGLGVILSIDFVRWYRVSICATLKVCRLFRIG
jgi:hypothetical protein